MSDERYGGFERVAGSRPLRCQSCGEQIGLLWGGEGQPDPQHVDARCYACRVLPEAEKITSEAVDDAF